MANSSNNENAEALANSVVSSFKKPMVSLLVEFDKYCAFEARVNDIPITSSSFYLGGPTSTYIPVNQYLKPNDNSLAIRAWPLAKNFPSDYKVSASISVIVWDLETMKPESKEAITLAKMTISLIEGEKLAKESKAKAGKQPRDIMEKVLTGNLDTFKSEGAEVDAVQLEHKGWNTWTAKRNFDPGFKVPPSKWQSSKVIKDNARTKKSVIKMYQLLWSKYHKNPDLEGWRRITFEGDNEVANMSYNTIDQLLMGTALGGILQGEDKSWELQDIDFETAQMRIVANGQLVTLLTDNLDAVIHYDSKIDENFRKDITIYLRKEGKGWVISR